MHRMVPLMIAQNFMSRMVSYALAGGVACACLALPVFAEMKQWTDVDGRQVLAELLEFDEARGVLFRLENKSEVWVAAEKLSVADRLFVRNWVASKALDQGENGDAAPVRVEPAAPVEPAPPSVERNFANPWPTVISVDGGLKIETLQEEELSYIYESPHFRFVSTARLQGALLRKVALNCEAIYKFCQALPLNFVTPRLPEKDKPKLEVMVYEKPLQYVGAGGRRGLGSCFHRENKRVMTTLKSLGVRVVGSGYTLNTSERYRELTNDLVHQLADPSWEKLPWLWEGLAAYIRATPYRTGKLVTSNMKSAVLDHVRYPPERLKRDEFDTRELTVQEQLEKVAEEMEDKTVESILDFQPGYGLGNRVTSPTLEKLMNFDAFQFDADLTDQNELARVHYGISTLFVYYLLHADGDGKGTGFKKMLAALQEGKSKDEAIAVLLDGRDYATLQKTFQFYWQISGFDIVFEGGNPAKAKVR